jgi:hypothetical protein
MLNPESPREIGRPSRAVGSPASVTGRYQHTACSETQIFNKGDIFMHCANRTCPNKGANWVLQEKLEDAGSL